MEIKLSDVGKRFNKEWIFRHINLTISEGSNVVIEGHNGSGKSTLLKLLLGYASPSEGEVEYGSKISSQAYKKIGFASPYLDLFGDLTLKETLEFNALFKGLMEGLDTKKVLEILGFDKIEDRLLKNLSSGMQQRVKLSMAIFAKVDVILLDEPCSNLDKQGKQWYLEQINNYKGSRTIVVCSNQEAEEYSFCTESINIEDYKNR